MSRSRKKTASQDITTKPAAAAATGITPAPPRAARGAGEPGGLLGGLPLWGGALLAALLLLVIGWALTSDEAKGPGKPGPATKPAGDGKDWTAILMEKANQGQLGRKWQPEPWAPAGEMDKIVDRFITLKKSRDPAANDLLGRPALTEDQVIDEVEIEPFTTDTFLRQLLTITTVYRGEPDDKEGRKMTPNHYTIVGIGPVSTPQYRVRDGKGGTPPSRSFITKDVELVIEVRGGKIVGVRSTTGG